MTFQEHFERLQTIHTLLSQHTLSIDEVVQLQAESKEHVWACEQILYSYENNLNLSSDQSTDDNMKSD